jgi:hypothetical protein
MFILRKVKIWLMVGLVLAVIVFVGFMIFYDFGLESQGGGISNRGLETSFLGRLQEKFVDDNLTSIKKSPRREGLPGEQFYEENEISFYPIKLQLIGIVEEFDKGMLKLKADDYVYEIKVSEEVGIRCMPETTTDKTGREIEMSKVFIDFSRVSVSNFDKISLEKSEDIFGVGNTVTVIAQREKDEVIYAQAIIAYGCENERMLKVEL